MTQEEKQLLLKDLSARLPYYTELYSNVADGNWAILTPVVISNLINADKTLIIKPYLRPMSSMTEEEWIKFYKWANCRIEKDFREIGSKSRGFGEGYEYLGIDDMSNAIDWLTAHHFDYRGLIPMGLALEAPNDMYKTE